MTNVVILHGKPDDFEYYDAFEPSPSNFSWIPWLQKQCLLNEISSQTPEVFRCFEAPYQDWLKVLDQSEINNETILVGHSCGGGMILRWLCENKDVKVKGAILVAPWLDPLGFMKKTFGHELFDFERDLSLLSRIEHPIIFHSDNDQESIQETLIQIKTAWPEFPVREFHNYEHFCFPNSTTKAFPELIEEVVKAI